MKISCSRKALEEALQKINCVVETSKIQSQYSFVKIEANNNTVILKGTGSIAALQIKCNGIIFENGNCCINARTLIQIITNILSDNVLLYTTSTAEFIVESDGIKIALETVVDQCFTDAFKNGDIPTDVLTTLTIDAKQLIEGMNKCLPFIDTIEGTILNGLHFENEDGGLRIIGCSSIAFASTLLQDIATNSSFQFTLPNKAASIIATIFEGSPTLSIAESFIYLSDKTHLLRLSIIRGRYPLIMSLLPKTTASKLQIIRSKFIEAFNLADVIALNTLVDISYTNTKCSIYYQNKFSSIIAIDEQIDTAEFRIDYTLLKKIFKVDPQTNYILEYHTPITPAVIRTQNTIFMIGLAVPVRKE